MDISPHLVQAIQSELSKSPADTTPYNWPVGKLAWARLKTGFDPERFPNPAEQNIALREHLKGRWAVADAQEKVRLATWIISDWGGIKTNRPKTISGYVEMTKMRDPTTPYKGVSSYSKVLSMCDPRRFAIYDSKVAASLNAIQLIQFSQGSSVSFVAFPCPASRNNEIKRFCEIVTRKFLVRKCGFKPVKEDNAYKVFLILLAELKRRMGKSILEIEMELFARAEDFCRQARLSLKPRSPSATRWYRGERG
jgi:hypothetical protein